MQTFQQWQDHGSVIFKVKAQAETKRMCATLFGKTLTLRPVYNLYMCTKHPKYSFESLFIFMNG